MLKRTLAFLAAAILSASAFAQWPGYTSKSGGGGGVSIGGAIGSGTAGRVLFEGAGPVVADSANLTYSDTGNVAGGALVTLGSGSTTSTGAAFGSPVSTFGGMYTTGDGGHVAGNYLMRWAANGSQLVIQSAVAGTVYIGSANGQYYAFTNNASNPTLQFGSSANAGISYIGSNILAIGSGANASAAGTLYLTTLANGSTGGTMGFTNTAGQGPSITAGTATGAGVAALSLTRTNNNAAVDTGVLWTFTDTTSAAGFKAFQIFGGAAGTTNLISIDKNGNTSLGGSLTVVGPTNLSSGALTLTTFAVGLGKMTASGSAPGATGAKLELVCGTGAGSVKLTVLGGTSTTPVTIVDNIGSGVTGC